MLVPLGMAEWCIRFWVTLTMTLTSGLISRFFVSGASESCYLESDIVHSYYINRLIQEKESINCVRVG